MTRTQFLSLFAIPFLPKVDLSEKSKPAFDVKRLQARIEYLEKYPLTEEECWPPEKVLKMYRETGNLVWNNNKTKVEWIATPL